jgi:uncharacterized membrane protein
MPSRFRALLIAAATAVAATVVGFAAAPSAHADTAICDKYGSTANGMQLQIWDCYGGANQRWRLA